MKRNNPVFHFKTTLYLEKAKPVSLSDENKAGFFQCNGNKKTLNDTESCDPEYILLLIHDHGMQVGGGDS